MQNNYPCCHFTFRSWYRLWCGVSPAKKIQPGRPHHNFKCCPYPFSVAVTRIHTLYNAPMGLFDGTRFERPVTCEICGTALAECRCPKSVDGKFLPPEKQKVSIRLEKRPGGKMVTSIAGLDPHASDLPGLLKKLRERCATGGTIKEAKIELQGDQRK